MAVATADADAPQRRQRCRKGATAIAPPSLRLSSVHHLLRLHSPSGIAGSVPWDRLHCSIPAVSSGRAASLCGAGQCAALHLRCMSTRRRALYARSPVAGVRCPPLAASASRADVGSHDSREQRCGRVGQCVGSCRDGSKGDIASDRCNAVDSVCRCRLGRTEWANAEDRRTHWPPQRTVRPFGAQLGRRGWAAPGDGVRLGNSEAVGRGGHTEGAQGARRTFAQSSPAVLSAAWPGGQRPTSSAHCSSADMNE